MKNKELLLDLLLINLPYEETTAHAWGKGSIKCRTYKIGEYTVQVIEYEGIKEVEDYDLYINGKFFKGEDTPE